MKVKQRAVKLLARREHSALELQQKLAKYGYEPVEIAETIEQLQHDGWQSDERFSQAYVRMRMLKGFGPIRINYELKERGIDEGLRQASLSEYDQDWLSILEREYLKKYGHDHSKDYQEKAKRMRFFQHRGFDAEKINEVVK